MTPVDAALLGLVQGLTEFLPVSSSGHLVLTASLLGLEPNLLFDVLVHLATLIATVLYYRKDVVQVGASLVKAPSCGWAASAPVASPRDIAVVGAGPAGAGARAGASVGYARSLTPRAPKLVSTASMRPFEASFTASADRSPSRFP